MSFEIKTQLDPDGTETEIIEETRTKTVTTVKLWGKKGFQDKITELEAQIVEIQTRIDILKEQIPKFTEKEVPK